MRLPYSIFIPLLAGSLLFAALSFTTIPRADSEPTLRNGIWRSSILRADGKEIVFNFQTLDSAGKKLLYVINGAEKLLVDNVKITGDSVFIEMPFFESGLAARLDESGNLRGSWLKRGADSVQVLPFMAIFNQPQRFPVWSPPRYNISGRWAVTFTNQKNEEYKSVGEFEQHGSKLTGTFLTETGDYRYQEGIVSGDTLKLSTFDGGHAYLFTARIENDSTISPGSFYSGAASIEKWSAKKNAAAALPDGYSATTLKPGENRLNFRFKSTDGKFVSINDNRYKGKVVIVQILGSWCPNCMDETKFLSDYYKVNRAKGVEMIGLAYERTTDWERSRKAINSFQKRFNVTYPILITGVTVSDTLKTGKTLPQVNKISAFPTSIFIDKKGIVRKIYTGFTGPGTGQHYEDFRMEFDATVRQLLEEK